MIIGSLHSMSYLEGHGFFNKLLSFINKTQKHTIQDQYEKYGVRAFDLHISFVGRNSHAVFKNGLISYYTFSVYSILNYLDKKGDTYVRIVLEDSTDDLNERFEEYCKIIEEIYPNITFFGGYREHDSKEIYRFNKPYPNDIIFFKKIDNIKLNG